jgi:ketosteroid isomerase-like protein
VVAHYTGTGQTTGKELDLRVVHVLHVHDGKIPRFRQFADTAKFLEVVPAEIATSGGSSRTGTRASSVRLVG